MIICLFIYTKHIITQNSNQNKVLGVITIIYCNQNCKNTEELERIIHADTAEEMMFKQTIKDE